MEVRTRTAPASAAALGRALRAAGTPSEQLEVVVAGTTIAIPHDLLQTLLDLLDDVAEGRVVTAAPANLPIGTELASDLLGVSRPWLTTLLDRGEIPFERIGSKRRVKLGDVLEYRRVDNERRRSVLTWEFLDEK